jgi:L-cysteine S-thiosulfotransferase
MARLPVDISVSALLCMVAIFCIAATSPVLGAECRAKTAGFYLQDGSTSSLRRLSNLAQSLPASLTGSQGDPERGRAILTNRQKGDCLSCHQLTALSSVGGQGTLGPPLDGIGARFNDGQLRQLVVDPKAYFPDTIMPSYYQSANSPEVSVLTAPEVEDLVAYMKTLK